MGQDLEVVHSLARDTEPGGVRQGHAAEAGEGGHPISEVSAHRGKQRNVVNQSIRTLQAEYVSFQKERTGASRH